MGFNDYNVLHVNYAILYHIWKALTFKQVASIYLFSPLYFFHIRGCNSFVFCRYLQLFPSEMKSQILSCEHEQLCFSTIELCDTGSISMYIIISYNKFFGGIACLWGSSLTDIFLFPCYRVLLDKQQSPVSMCSIFLCFKRLCSFEQKS